MKDVYNYNDVDVSKITLKFFCSYFWYLLDEAIEFAFLDNNVSLNFKKKDGYSFKFK